MPQPSTVFIAAIFAAANLLSVSTARAHGDAANQGHASPASMVETVPVETTFGRTGDPKKVTRTIRIEMSDAMRFTPASITVSQGETVRFVVTNSGRTLHEMVLGTAADLKAHAELMRKHPGMEHDEPYMAHVAPGRNSEIVWQFTAPGEYQYGCLIPGHFEAGMAGRIVVLATSNRRVQR